MTTSQSSDSSHFDMTELGRNLQDCATFHNEVGALNPRNPGLHNDLIQFAKKIMRRSLTWYTRPLHQFQNAVIRTLNELTRALQDGQMRHQRLEVAWQQNVPAFLNAVSSVGAFGHELAQLRREMHEGLQSARSDLQTELRSGLQSTGESIAATWERIEFTRREIMFEIKYAKPAPEASAPPLEARIVSQDKVAAALPTGLRLNLGCGHIPLKDYVNVDRRELPGVDVVADAGDLPFEKGSVQEISSAHLLEHFPQEMLRRQLLPFWRSLLKPGGLFKAVVPDGEAMLSAVAGDSYSFDDFREVLFGAQDYDGDFHFNLFTPDSLRALLEEARFEDVYVGTRARRNGKCFEFEISAVKPS